MEATLVKVYEPSLSDKRRYHRHLLRLPMTVKLLAQSSPAGAGRSAVTRSYSRTAFLHNISLSGLCFTTNRLYDLDILMEVRLTVWSREYQIQGIVRRSYIEKNGYYSMQRTAIQYVRGGEIEAFIPALGQYLGKSPYRLLK